MPLARPRFVWDVVVTAGSNAVRLRRSDATEVTATVAAGTYRIIGSVAGSDLLLAVKTAFEAAIAGGFTLTPSVLTTIPGGRVRLAGSTTFGILWTDALTTWKASGRNDLGFDTAANDTGASSYDSDYQHANGWYPDTEVEHDTEDEGHAFIGTARSRKGIRRTLRFGTVTERLMTFRLVQKRKIHSASATPNEDFRNGLWDWGSQGKKFELYADVASTTLTGTYEIRDERWMTDWPVQIDVEAGPRYRLEVPMETFVT